ncbi:39S ribosomal protein L51, mitochondrial [Malassezia sp. CBS 17886]|nr:39S ribosomal protein L51, mitochondrial [Malassezia sp. CBS 17886]
MAGAHRVLRSALSTRPQVGGPVGTYTLPCRKLVIEYHEKNPASAGTRDFLLRSAAPLARRYPSVEFVVTPRPQNAPVLRGFYLNGRAKDISSMNLDATQVARKVQLLLDSSGMKTGKLKRNPVVSTSESARGIWSPFHDAPRKL